MALRASRRLHITPYFLLITFPMLTPRIIKKISKANLIGRGCNSFATSEKWKIVLAEKSKEKFVICNISESEPGVFKDKYVLENHPEKIIEGMSIAMQTLKATQGFIYINPEYYSHYGRVLQEILNLQKIKNIEIYCKPLHDYIGGEESAVINSMQGKRIEPNLKPPFPTTSGFQNSPTLVNNCETFFAISQIKNKKCNNTRFYCLAEYSDADDINVGRRFHNQHPQKTKYKNQKVKELPTDITVKKALEAFGHKPSNKYFYQIGGGASGSCYNHKQLNRPFKGLASIIIYKSDFSEKDLVLNWINFFVNESCGQCVPCREGTFRLQEILENHYLNNQQINQEVFDNLILSLQESSLCPLGKSAPTAILSYYKNILNRDIKNFKAGKCEIK